MFNYPRSHPAHRIAAGVLRTVGPRGRTTPRRVCWVTRRGRSVTRLTRTARGPTREWFHRGDAWGVVRAVW